MQIFSMNTDYSPTQSGGFNPWIWNLGYRGLTVIVPLVFHASQGQCP